MKTLRGGGGLVLAASITGLALTACSSGASSSPDSAEASSSVAAASSANLVNPDAVVDGPITIGLEDLGSSRVMAEVYAQALKEAGFDVQLTVPGQPADFVAAMQAGVVDVLPAFSGVFANYLYKAQNNDAEPPVWTDQLDAESAVNDMGAELGIEMLPPSPFNEGAVFAVSKDFSDATGITTLSQMAEWSKKNPMRLGAEETCLTRPYCKPNLEETYGMQIKDFVPLSADGAVVRSALMEGGAELGWLPGSDPVLDSPDLVALQQDKPLNIYRNFAPVIRRDIATPEVVAALNSVNQKVTDEDLAAMVAAVQVDGEPIGRVAGDYVAAQGLGEGLYAGPTKVVGADVPVELDAPPTAAAEGGPLRISYAPLTDSEIAARVYGGALVNAGIPIQISAPQDPVDIVAAIPSGEVQFAPMRLNVISNILNTQKNGNLALPIEGRDVESMVSRTRDLAAPRGIEVLDASTANVTSAWTVNSNFVANTGIKTLSELARVSQNRPVILGGPPPCPEREWCQRFLQEKYGIKFSQFVPLDFGGGLTRGAIDSGAVDVGWLSGSDGGIEEFGFTVLPDDLGRESANPIIPVLDAEAVTPQIEKVLNAVSTEFSTDDLKRMNHQIEFERQEITDVVAAWLEEHGFA